MTAPLPRRPSESGADPLIFLIAGEPSGDQLAGRLMEALKERTGGKVCFAGVGGEEMGRAGLKSLFPMAELSVMGFLEVVPKIPRLLRRIRQTAAEIRRLRPDAVVSVDSPGFSFRVAKRVAGQGIPLIHYVAPSVWAYAPGRAKRIAAFLDHVLALLPFEPPYFEAEGLPCTYVGHPVVEYGIERRDGARFRDRHGIPPDAPVLAVLPGSRHSETSRLLPVFGEALARLAKEFPGLWAVAPTVSTVADAVGSAAALWPVATVAVTDPAEKYDAFAASNVALAASGTVSVELAACGVPHVVAYRVNPPTALIARLLLRIEYASLVNLVMDRPIVPELLQEKCTGTSLAEHVARLLTDREATDRQRRDLAEAVDRLSLKGVAPSQRAADVVLSVIAESATQTKTTAAGAAG